MIWVKKYIQDFFSMIGIIWLIIEASSFFFAKQTAIIQNQKAFVIVIITCLLISFIINYPRRKIACKINAVDSSIVIQIGNLLDCNDDIVFSSSNFFNTDIDIISPDSLLGKYIKKNNLDFRIINNEISNSLQGLKATPSKVKKGNTLSFPIGSVAHFFNNKSKIYLLAITKIDDNGVNIKSHSDRPMVEKSLNNLWNKLRNTNDNRIICMPAIGTGIGNSFQQNRDSILNICMSFINESKKKKICNKLKIVVRKQDYSPLEFEQLRNSIKYLIT